MHIRAKAGSLARKSRKAPRPAAARAANPFARLNGRQDLGDQLRRDRVVGGEEGVVLVLEVLVEGAPRDAGGHDDALDGHLGVAGGAYDVGHRGEDPLTLVLRHERARQPMSSRGQLIGFALTRQRMARLPLGHAFREIPVSGVGSHVGRYYSPRSTIRALTQFASLCGSTQKRLLGSPAAAQTRSWLRSSSSNRTG